MESNQTSLEELLKQAQAKYDAMTHEQQVEIQEEQHQSFVRSIVNWPKSNYYWENGVEVYHSFEDYCND
jgi:hypothetical protein